MKKLLNKNFIGLLLAIGLILIPSFKTEAIGQQKSGILGEEDVVPLVTPSRTTISPDGSVTFTVNADQTSYPAKIGGEVATISTHVSVNNGGIGGTVNISGVLSTSNTNQNIAPYTQNITLMSGELSVSSSKSQASGTSVINLPNYPSIYRLYVTGTVSYYDAMLEGDMTKDFSTTIDLIVTPSAPTFNMSVDKTEVTAGDSVVVSWDSTGTTGCTCSYGDREGNGVQNQKNAKITWAAKEYANQTLEDKALKDAFSNNTYIGAPDQQGDMDGFYYAGLNYVNGMPYTTSGSVRLPLAVSSDITISCQEIPFINQILNSSTFNWEDYMVEVGSTSVFWATTPKNGVNSFGTWNLEQYSNFWDGSFIDINNIIRDNNWSQDWDALNEAVKQSYNEQQAITSNIPIAPDFPSSFDGKIYTNDAGKEFIYTSENNAILDIRDYKN